MTCGNASLRHTQPVGPACPPRQFDRTMSGMSEATDRESGSTPPRPSELDGRPFLLPAAVADLPASVPALEAVHRLAPAELDALAERWEAARSDPAGSAEQHRILERVGPAACRLRELRRAERRATTCPACGFDRLDRPPYLAFEGLPEDVAEQAALAPPYAIHFGDPSRERCPCCGYGFGIDDDPDDGSDPVSFRVWSRRWIERGHPWHDGSRRPTGRSVADQLAAVGRAERTA
jgi:hypothetical protein